MGPRTGTGGMRILRRSLFSWATTGSCFSYTFTAWVNRMIPAIVREKIPIMCSKHLSHLVGKPTICIGKNKGADQLRGNREADQRLCFCYSDSTTPLLLKSKISSFYLFSVLVQAGLCRTCLETTLLVFPQGGSFENCSS